MNSKLYKLAKMVLNLAEIETDKAKLIIDGEAEVGKEVFVEDENGELIAPEDGEYEAEAQILVITDGKIAEINEKEQEGGEAPEAEQPEEAPVESEQAEEQPEAEEAPEADPKDEKDKRIAELEAQVEELNNVIVEKDELIGELRKQLEETDAKPAEEQLKSLKEENKSWFKPRF